MTKMMGLPKRDIGGKELRVEWCTGVGPVRRMYVEYVRRIYGLLSLHWSPLQW